MPRSRRRWGQSCSPPIAASHAPPATIWRSSCIVLDPLRRQTARTFPYLCALANFLGGRRAGRRVFPSSGIGSSRLAMFPTVVTSEVQRALLDYLRTTFRLADKELEEALFRFLKDEQTGMFRGPYLDVRLPFRKAPEDWEARSPLDFGPPFLPHAHQLRAFERLSARDRQPQNTLVTTGTGSGKTECFLFPLLDHCRRARQRGEGGVKAIILYPMNALATDQAERLAKLLQRRSEERRVGKEGR